LAPTPQKLCCSPTRNQDYPGASWPCRESADGDCFWIRLCVVCCVCVICWPKPQTHTHTTTTPTDPGAGPNIARNDQGWILCTVGFGWSTALWVCLSCCCKERARPSIRPAVLHDAGLCKCPFLSRREALGTRGRCPPHTPPLSPLPFLQARTATFPEHLCCRA